MKTLASLFIAAVAFAALATSAVAKEVKSANVCGASDCVTVTDRDKAMLLVGGDGRPGSPPPASAFYTVEATVTIDDSGGTGTWSFYYVPSQATTRPAYDPRGDMGPSSHAWWAVSSQAAALFGAVTRGLEPFPAPDVSEVVIGSKTVVEGADSYLRLYELPRTRGALPNGLPVAYSEWINLRSTEPTPWTDLPRDLSFSPSAGLMERGGQVVRIPEEFLADIEAGRPLTPEAAPDGAGFPWRTLAGALVAALAGAIAIAVLMRRLRIPFPRRRPSEA